jgi:hypothetical protein
MYCTCYLPTYTQAAYWLPVRQFQVEGEPRLPWSHEAQSWKKREKRNCIMSQLQDTKGSTVASVRVGGSFPEAFLLAAAYNSGVPGTLVWGAKY